MTKKSTNGAKQNGRNPKQNSRKDKFLPWLLGQRGRRDMVGELVDYINRAKQKHKPAFKAHSTRQLIQNMAWFDAPPRMFSILNIAHDEFKNGGYDDVDTE